MYKYPILYLLIFICSFAKSQNIYTALQLNQEREYKTRKPKKILEHNTFYNDSGKDTFKSVKIFDDSGMLLTEDRFDKDGAMSAKLTYKNDTVNRVVLSRIFERWTRIGRFLETATYKYSPTNALISISDSAENGSLISFSEITVNDQGHPIALKLFDGKGNQFGVERATYIYDKNMVITTVFNPNNELLSTDTTKISFINASKFPLAEELYNDKGDLISGMRKTYTGLENSHESEYTYDLYGNCTESRNYLIKSKGKGKTKRIIQSVFKKEYSY